MSEKARVEDPLSDPLNLGDFRLNMMCNDLMMSIQDAINAPHGAIKLRPNTAQAFENFLRSIKALDEVTTSNIDKFKGRLL